MQFIGQELFAQRFRQRATARVASADEDNTAWSRRVDVSCHDGTGAGYLPLSPACLDERIGLAKGRSAVLDNQCEVRTKGLGQWFRRVECRGTGHERQTKSLGGLDRRWVGGEAQGEVLVRKYPPRSPLRKGGEVRRRCTG